MTLAQQLRPDTCAAWIQCVTLLQACLNQCGLSQNATNYSTKWVIRCLLVSAMPEPNMDRDGFVFPVLPVIQCFPLRLVLPGQV